MEREERLEAPGQVTGQPCLGLYPKRPAGLGRRGPWIKIPALTLTLLVAVCFPVSPDLHCWFPVGQPDMVFLTLWLGSSDHVSALSLALGGLHRYWSAACLSLEKLESLSLSHFEPLYP